MSKFKVGDTVEFKYSNGNVYGGKIEGLVSDRYVVKFTMIGSKDSIWSVGEIKHISLDFKPEKYAYMKLLEVPKVKLRDML